MNQDEEKSNGLVISRTFNVPREKVWRTWTEPEQIKKWWGPKDFTAPEIQIDLREGGKYLYCMRGVNIPGGKEEDFWSGGTFQEIVPMERIVDINGFRDKNGNRLDPTAYGFDEDFPKEMELIVTFSGDDEKTTLTLAYPNVGAMNQTDLANMKMGWNQSLDKFADALKN